MHELDMRLNEGEIDALGQELLEAFESGRPVAPLTERYPGLRVDDAYGIQRALVDRHVSRGRAIAGRKIGLTSLAMQQQLGIDSPDFGVVLDSHTFASGARLSPSRLRMIAPRLEPEVAFILRHELDGPGITASDVVAATRGVAPVFEVIDSRVADWRIGLADTVADNASCFGMVLGAEVPLDSVGPLAGLEVRFSGPDGVLHTGRGSAVMGDPAVAVAWLANELGRYGETLPAGQPILSGSFTAASQAAPGRYEASFGAVVGSVVVEIAS